MVAASGSDLNGAAKASAPERADAWVWLGRIRRPQGRKGEVFAEILTDFPEKFTERKRLWLLQQPSSAKPGFVSGHDLSRAAKVTNRTGALAPEGSGVPCEVELIAHWLHKGGVVLHFAGVDSISAAETLSGLIVAIPRAERAVLGEDEVFISDLIGCALVDVAGATPTSVGEIEDVDTTTGPVALLVVKGATGEVLIPFAKSYLRKIDLKARRVEMALPEGLVDLNGPEKTQ